MFDIENPICSQSEEMLAWANLFFQLKLLGHNIYVFVYYGVLGDTV